MSDPSTSKRSSLQKNEPFLSLIQLGLSFGSTQRQAYHGIDLQVKKGEFISIIGPSGCGKSTLLKTVAGLMKPTQGKVRWSTEQEPESAFIFQDPTLLPWMTALQNVEVPLRLKRQPRSQRTDICRNAIQQVLLDNYQHDYPKSLSGGMKMRVSLARAMTLHPDVMLLDEPFGALDAITRNQMNQLLLNLKEQQNWTALMVTHSVNEAVYMSDRVIVMTHSPGTVLKEIPVLLEHPRQEAMQMSKEYLNHVQLIRELIGKEVNAT